jgi:hypothetical protein
MLSIQQEHQAALALVDELKEKIVQMEHWETEKKRYALKAVAPGAFAYAVKPNRRRAETPHWLCATCYQAGKKGFLQASLRSTDKNKKVWVCALCPTEIVVPWSRTPECEAPAESARGA